MSRSRLYRSLALATLSLPLMTPGSVSAAYGGTSVHASPAFVQESTFLPQMASVRDGKLTHAVLEKRISINLRRVSLAAALDEVARLAGARIGYARDLLPDGRRVSVRGDRVSVREALRRMLNGTDLDVLVSRSGNLALVRREAEVEPELHAEPVVGTITGRVTDAGTGAGVSGASVRVEDTSLGAITGNTGRYRITGVPAGTYTVVVQQVGYAEAGQSVTVNDGEQATADFALEVSALPLDEIVATGTAFATEARTLPNPINVITAKDIEQKQVTNITDLLRGEIPGVMALTVGQNDYSSTIYVRGNASGSSGDYIKIYIDGIEVANPVFLSTLDPSSIERIEVVRGAQASAIYGSEAASGVLQIFTKKGRPGLARPQLELRASLGPVESDYTPAGAGTPLTQDHALEVSGGGESFSYRAGASYGSMGEWVKNYGSRTFGLSGGLRAVHGPLTVELTALWSDRDYDNASSPIYLRYPAGACAQCGNPDYVQNWDFALSQNTMGLAVHYQATDRWLHTLTVGDDQNRWSFHQPEPSYNTPADTFVRLYNQEYRRRSVRYHTAYEAELGGVTARLTGGVDYWSYDVQGSNASNLLEAFGQIRASANSAYTVDNDGWWNAGYFGMVELGFQDQLFLTLAGRVEDNPNLGEAYGRAFAPRVGASYVQALGSAEVKVRAQWGKGVRPPPSYARPGRVFACCIDLPNPGIAPEEKSGWDGGVDVYWGDRASLSVTRYDEVADNLITRVAIDPTATPLTRQYQNIGVVDIEGWEVEGSVRAGRVRMSANYAYSESVVREVTEAQASDPNATLLPGDRTDRVPKHSGGGRVTVAVGRGSVSVDGNVMSGWRGRDNLAYYGYVYAGDSYRGSDRAYYIAYPSLWKWNLRAEQALTERLTAYVKVDNLANDQGGDIDNSNVTPGRTTVVGVRWSW